MPATRDTYKGHPTLTLTREGEDGKGFTFGLAKAKLIVANIAEIEAFVMGEGKTEEKEAA